jgi:transcriptional regulator with XRE-family HTH domain
VDAPNQSRSLVSVAYLIAIVINLRSKITIVSKELAAALRDARRAARLSQQELADRAGLTRMTVQKLEAGIDPRISTIDVVARALGLELVLVPTELKLSVEEFLRSGGRIVAQAPGIGAPASIVDVLARVPAKRKRHRR